MNKEITPPVKGYTLASLSETTPGKGIHYGLIILIELAENYCSGGCSLTYISKKNGFPLYALIPVTLKLEEAGLIDFQMSDPDWLFLKDEPYGTWIKESVLTLKQIFYSGKK